MWMTPMQCKVNARRFLKVFFPSYCYICKIEGSAICSSCLKKRTLAIETPSPVITSIYSFKDPSIKKIIHAIKYFHRKDLVAPLVAALADEILQKNTTGYVLVPIPMPLLRKYIRGHNHAETIAYEISHYTGIPLRKDLLSRAVTKKRQVTTTSRYERLKNQHGSFSVNKDVLGMSIFLIDDVTTTGATLLEARRLLLKKGASHVEAFTVAH